MHSAGHFRSSHDPKNKSLINASQLISVVVKRRIIMHRTNVTSLLRLGMAVIICLLGVVVQPVNAERIAVAEELLVDLRAEDLAAGSVSEWPNRGSLGGVFTAFGNPQVVDVGGWESVSLDGDSFFEGPRSVPGIEGGDPRSVEIWAYKIGLAGEQTMVSWAHRGGPEGTNFGFNYADNASWGAVGHWGGGPDMGWGGNHAPTPALDTWWHLAYTYDGATARLYVNGEPAGEEAMTLNTHAGGIIRVGAQGDGTGESAQPDMNFIGGIAQVRIHEGVLTPAEIQKNALIRIQVSETASEPSPGDGDSDVLRDGLLTWQAGETAVTRNVYLGTAFDDVDSATEPTASGLTETLFDPGRLAFDQVYYWRVDEVNGAPDNTVFKGDVWSFTAEPYSIPIPGSTITVTASSSSSDYSKPEKVLDGSGLGEDGSHDITPETMWFTASPDMDPWIQFEFDGIKQLDTMTIWNSNGAAETAIGWGVKDVVIEYSQDGENWDVLEGAYQFSRASGLATYNQPDEIAFNGVPVKYVRLDITSNWGGIIMSYSLSEVEFAMIPSQARTPVPAAGSTDIRPNAVVTWRAGREAAQHTIYVDTDADAVADGSAPSTTSNTNSLALDSLGLQLGETYYWRVDEVNEAEPTPVWEGPVWSLSIMNTVVVEDFEGYGNASPDRPFQTWLDGFGYSPDEHFSTGYNGNGTGGGIGHDIWTLSSPHYDGDIMETTTVINGSTQSLPFYFTNTGGAASQTDRTFATPQDWTAGGITTLSIAVHGNLSLSAANQLYVKINNTKVVYEGDLSVPIWQQWHIDLAALGINLSGVTTMSFGVDGTGSGMVLLDDILLHRTAPPVVGPPAGSDRSLVAHWTFDETEGLTAADSSGYGNDGTLVGMAGTEWTAGHSGGALELAGAVGSPQYVDFGTGTSMQLSGSATISAWVKMNAGTDGVYMGIGGKLRTAPYAGFSLVRHSSHVFRLWADDGNATLVATNSDVATYTDTEWHHVVGVIDNGITSLYVDGVKQISSETVSLTDSGEFAHIGRQYAGLDDRYWNGAVDDVRIYYRALSEQEISGL